MLYIFASVDLVLTSRPSKQCIPLAKNLPDLKRLEVVSCCINVGYF